MVITAKLIETSYIRDMYYNKDVKRADDCIIKRYRLCQYDVSMYMFYGYVVICTIVITGSCKYI